MMLLEKQNVNAKSFFVSHAEIKHVLQKNRTQQKALALKMIQKNYQQGVAIIKQNEDVSSENYIIKLMKMLSLGLVHLKSFLSFLAQGQKDVRLIGLIRLGIMRLEMFVGLHQKNKHKIDYLEITG